MTRKRPPFGCTRLGQVEKPRYSAYLAVERWQHDETGDYQIRVREVGGMDNVRAVIDIPADQPQLVHDVEMFASDIIEAMQEHVAWHAARRTNTAAIRAAYERSRDTLDTDPLHDEVDARVEAAYLMNDRRG